MLGISAGLVSKTVWLPIFFPYALLSNPWLKMSDGDLGAAVAVAEVEVEGEEGAGWHRVEAEEEELFAPGGLEPPGAGWAVTAGEVRLFSEDEAGSAKELFTIVLLIPINLANISQRGHLTVLPPDALKDTRLLCVGMELSEKDNRWFDVRDITPRGTMSAEVDALTVVNQLRDLAADPLNRRAIVEDQGCLPGLILFLDHPNPQVVYSALLAVRYLAECRANREKMKGELGMMLSLQNVMQKQIMRGMVRFRPHPLELRSTSPGETKLLSSEIYEILQSAGQEEAEQAEAAAASCRRKAHFFLGSNNKRAKTVVLHIDGLDDSTRRSLCEEALLKIRGVISFTFQMAVKRCVVRIRSDLKAEALGTAINSTKVMTAQQVVKTEDGGELMVPFQEDAAVLVEENTDIPDYLPEDESPSQEQDKAVTRVGSITDGMGWLSTAANFLTRSFYW
ncbi:hypothetical protein INR49_014506 [Caranx melampygus]|nr:hypothetical protein INR49_014506 [Caranx melampygus]